MSNLFKQTSIIVILVSLFFCNKSFAALNGNYTIDGSSPATANNYQDFISVANDLAGNARLDGGPANGPGVSGPVMFNVAAGTYTGQFIIPAVIGASSVNTITFDGGTGNAATRIIQAG